MGIVGVPPVPGPYPNTDPSDPGYPSTANYLANYAAQLAALAAKINSDRANHYAHLVEAYQISVNVRPDIKPAWALPQVPFKVKVVDGVLAETSEPVCDEIPIKWPAAPPVVGNVHVGNAIAPGYFSVGVNDRVAPYATITYQGMKLQKIPSIFGGPYGAGGWYQVVP